MTIVTKHAIEDYVLYLYKDVIDEMVKTVSRCPQLMNLDILERHMHKKLALLVALRLCYTRIEELFLGGLDDDKLDRLLQVCDGLKILTDTIANMLSV